MNPAHKPIVFCFPDDAHLAEPFIRGLEADTGRLEWRRFPDRESLVTLHGSCADRDVLLLCTLTDPDTKALPLYFCATTARELGARRVGLVAPYLGYMRQDLRFSTGQSRSAFAFGRLLSSCFDWLVTVDPHLHRIHNLNETLSIPNCAVSSMPAVSRWIATHLARPVLIGPDLESAQWAECVARTLDAPCLILEKVRSGDRDVKVSAIDHDVIRGRNPVIIDDIASSGHTMAEALKGFEPRTALDITCIAVHALLDDNALKMLFDLGARRVVSTNTVLHSTNQIDVVDLIVAGVREQLDRG